MHVTTKLANLEKIRQRFGEKSKIFEGAPLKVAILTKILITCSLTRGGFDENGDLTKNRDKSFTKILITCPKRPLEKLQF